MTGPTPLDPSARALLDACLSTPGVPSLESVLQWLLAADPAPHNGSSPRTERLHQLARAWDAHPEHAELEQRLRAVWTHGSTVRLLAETGIPVHVTLAKETVGRLVDRLVPRLEPDDDLYVLLTRLALTPADAAWVESLSEQSLTPWKPLVALPLGALLDAAVLVSLRAAAVGLARELLELTPSRAESASPFFQLPAVVRRVAEAPADPERWETWETCHAECRATLASASEHLDTRGVTTDLIYRLELLEALLKRLKTLLEVACGRADGASLAAQIILGAAEQRGVRSLARTSIKRLARKVVEHTGETGERYVVTTKRDWSEIGRTAGYAGILTAFTALVKYLIGGLPLSLMMLGLGLTINYAVSFVVLQLCHWTLASKQPAMTAAALAAALEHRDDVADQVELVAGIARSQVIATIANVVITMPIAVAVVAASLTLFGRAPIGEAAAIHTVHGTHPFTSFTIPFAMLTGVFLWMASLAAGWAANWSAYRGLSVAVARHRRLRALVGEQRARKIGVFLEHHLGGIVGYVALGFLLGFMPEIFQFIGLPIEVRHVTLNAASLGIGAASLYGSEAFHWSDVLWGLGGILVTGICNVGVSFSLALRTAMRARDLGRPERARLWAAIRQAFRASPRRFLWRPKE